MSGIFSQRLLLVWIVAAALTFLVSLYFMGGAGEGAERIGPSTYSRSAIGYAGLFDVLDQLGLPVVRSRSDSLGKLTRGSVLVLAEPRPAGKTEAIMRTLLSADTVLLVLPKWTGQPSRQKPGWLGEAVPLPDADIAWALHLVAPRADLVRVDKAAWSTNALGLVPDLDGPVDLVRGGRLRPLIGNSDGMLLGELTSRTRKIWVLADPDVAANHGIVRDGNAALAAAIIGHLRTGSGSVVFDETIHGFSAEIPNPLLMLLHFPFAIATLEGAVAIALLLWATLGRFGPPQPAPPPLDAGRRGLLENTAKLVDFTGHHEVMVKRYVLETVRDAGRQLHAPRDLSTAALIAWLQRVATARGVATDCGPLIREAAALGQGSRASAAMLVRLARQIHRWKEEIVDGRARHSHDR